VLKYAGPYFWLIETVLAVAATLNVSKLTDTEYAEVVAIIERVEAREASIAASDARSQASDQKIVSTSVHIAFFGLLSWSVAGPSACGY
jgi:predicted metal-dependent TIM-barrel fold hydrolase